LNKINLNKINIQKLRERVNNQMKESKCRGAQIGVIVDGEIIALECFGVRNDKNDPVTEKTIFPIASTTKAFTAAMVASLVDKRLLNWNDKLSKYLDDFKMMDETATKLTNIKDALSHRTGIARHDYAWMGTGFSMEQLVKNLRYLPPFAEFRTVFHYSNIMYSTVSYLVEKVTGKRWFEVMKENVTDPIGMDDTFFTVNETMGKSDYALPFKELDGVRKDYSLFNLDNNAGAGAINSNIKDMMKWVKFLLNEGEVDGKQIVSKANLLETFRPTIIADNSSFWKTPEFKNRTYALGWYNEVFRGMTMMRHTGGINGFFSQVLFIPEKQIGVVVLTNTDGSDICGLISNQIVDEILGFETIDYWNNINKIQDETISNGYKKNRDYFNPLLETGSKSNRENSDYEGTYINPAYPTVTVKSINGELTVETIAGTLKANHLFSDTFVLDFNGQMYIPVEFEANENDEIERMKLRIEHNLPFGIEFIKN